MRYSEREFENKTIRLDGNEFVHCSFEGCTFVYAGGKPPTIEGCSFFSAPKIVFEGSANATLLFLAALRAGGFAETIDATLDRIRDGSYIARR
jgi:hypothetical protein